VCATTLVPDELTAEARRGSLPVATPIPGRLTAEAPRGNGAPQRAPSGRYETAEPVRAPSDEGLSAVLLPATSLTILCVPRPPDEGFSAPSPSATSAPSRRVPPARNVTERHCQAALDFLCDLPTDDIIEAAAMFGFRTRE
jgi:hypothetical protein